MSKPQLRCKEFWHNDLVMLREKLKQELDKLSEVELQKVADFIAFIEFQAREAKSIDPSG